MNDAWKRVLLISFGIFLIQTSLFSNSIQMPTIQAFTNLSDPLDSICKILRKQQQEISLQRREQLEKIAQYAHERLRISQKAQLIFICTHNSRRSQIAQLWVSAAARYYGVKDIVPFSGGTEITAFNIRAVAAMRRVGFLVDEHPSLVPSETAQKLANPHYTVRYGDAIPSMEIFSKRYNDTANPHKNFAAIMVCSHAEQNCPLVLGADVRLSLPYNDPKDFDGTPHETIKYDERVREIGRDMLYLIEQIRKKLQNN
jgi:arsenate reductase (thioredoxin)